MDGFEELCWQKKLLNGLGKDLKKINKKMQYACIPN
jgi:hypothetical protein